MFKYVFLIIVGMHGLIHLLGFAKALNPNNVTQLTQGISMSVGLLWLLTAILLIATVILFAVRTEYWWMIGIVAMILSQVLICTVWSDAKFGTIPNIILLVVIILTMSGHFFEKNYQNDVIDNLNNNVTSSTDMLTNADIENLPVLVQNYLIYSGSVNKPKVYDMNVIFEGKMRAKGKEYFNFQSEQYNFFANPARLFFMKAQIFSMPVLGYHRYANAKASMDIRLFGLVSVSKHAQESLDIAETVTVFNDMCLMAPATLIDKRIVWEPIDSKSTKATFTNKGITISAILYFNANGQLTNFVSDDRIDVNENKRFRFSTPVSAYKDFNGYNLPSYGETVWDYPDGKFTYGIFNLKKIQYNTRKDAIK